MKSNFSAHQSFLIQKFTPHHTDGPHHMMLPPQFMISAQHWYTVQKELYTKRILCGCQSWSRYQILRGVDLFPGLIINSLLWSYRFLWWDSQVWIGLSTINQRTHCSCCHTLYWFIPTGYKSITYMFYIIIIQYSSAWPLALNCVCTVHLCPRHPDVTVATKTKHPSPWSLVQVTQLISPSRQQSLYPKACSCRNLD